MTNGSMVRSAARASHFATQKHPTVKKHGWVITNGSMVRSAARASHFATQKHPTVKKHGWVITNGSMVRSAARASHFARGAGPSQKSKCRTNPTVNIQKPVIHGAVGCRKATIIRAQNLPIFGYVVRAGAPGRRYSEAEVSDQARRE